MTAPQPTGTTMVPLARIAIGYNPRRYFDSKKHDELVASLRLRGMLQPILVRPADDGKDRYIIVAGGRRYRAALEAFGADGEPAVLSLLHFRLAAGPRGVGSGAVECRGLS